jgi:hypothetical protein
LWPHAEATMRIRLHLTRAGVWWLLFAVVAASAFWILVQRYVELPEDWAWLDWKKRRRRSWNLWDVFVFVSAIGVGVVVYWVGGLVLRRLGIEVSGRAPRTKRRVDD